MGALPSENYKIIRLGGSLSKIFEVEVTRIVENMDKVQRLDQKVTVEIRYLDCLSQKEEV